jgi:hypothetical protein
MRLLRSLWLHSTLTVVAAVSAWLVAAPASGPKRMSDWVQVWPGDAKAVSAIAYRGPGIEVTLKSEQDANGRFWRVNSRVMQPAAAPQSPEVAPAATVEEVSVISVAGGDELAELVAPLRAQRGMGPLAAERLAEFGFDEPAGVLTVGLPDGERRLTLGGKTAGGGDRYGRVEPGGEVFAVSGQIMRMLESAAPRLAERQLHGEGLESARLLRWSAGGSTRTLERSNPKEGWRRSEDHRVDDVLGNWLRKLETAPLQDYLPSRPEGFSSVAALEYFAGGKRLGFLEFGAFDQQGTRQYALRSERTRWYVTLPAKQGEELEATVR